MLLFALCSYFPRFVFTYNDPNPLMERSVKRSTRELVKKTAGTRVEAGPSATPAWVPGA
jgi:hypothetical protein